MKISNAQKEILTASEVAELLSVNIATIWRWTRKGRLKSYQIEGKKYYKYGDIYREIFGDSQAA